jgi:hypothetical protein
MGGQVLNVLYQAEFFKKPLSKNILTTLFLISFIVTPVKSSLETVRTNINKEMYILGSELNKRYNIRGNISSNRQKLHTEMHDSWHYTFRLSYWLKSRYFGMPREDISDEELVQDLKKHDIDFYFFWGNPETAPVFLFRHKELTGGEIPELTIFALKESRS